jgi:hypothetical protein
MSQKLTVVESNNNYYPVYYNIYDSMYECKKLSIQNIKIKNVN